MDAIEPPGRSRGKHPFDPGLEPEFVLEELRSLMNALLRLGGEERRGLVIFLASGVAIIVVAYFVGRMMAGI